MWHALALSAPSLETVGRPATENLRTPLILQPNPLQGAPLPARRTKLWPSTATRSLSGWAGPNPTWSPRPPIPKLQSPNPVFSSSNEIPPPPRPEPQRDPSTGQQLVLERTAQAAKLDGPPPSSHRIRVPSSSASQPASYLCLAALVTPILISPCVGNSHEPVRAVPSCLCPAPTLAPWPRYCHCHWHWHSLHPPPESHSAAVSSLVD